MAIGVLITRHLVRTDQWLANPLAAATGFIFLSCGAGHGLLAIIFLDPALGFSGGAGDAIRFAYHERHMWVWDLLTGATGVWYWTLRSRVPGLLRGIALFEDHRLREARALALHDNVVQGLVEARLAFELERDEQGRAVVARTLETAESMVTELLALDEKHPGAKRSDVPETGVP